MKVFKAIQRGVESAVDLLGWPLFLLALGVWVFYVVYVVVRIALLIGGE